MKLFRNPEVGKTLTIYTVISIIACIVAGCLDRRALILTLILCLTFIFVYMWEAKHHYDKLASLSEDIDKILHGKNNLSFDAYTEGEVGILKNEISKMTVRLREQQQKLMDDKVYLADSIADISHQIRTPLTSINLIVSFLSEPGLGEERKTQLLRELNELLKRIDWLIVTLLKISKLDAGTVKFVPEYVDLRELINKSSSPLLIPIELKQQELEVSANGKVSCDIAWTCEALGNIVKNCMEHTPEKGKLTIVASENPMFSEIIIEDTGNGINPEDLPHIFERFYKGKDSGDKSFGVGLALARMIISKQNGTIKAENVHNSGAKFTVRFYKGAV